MVRALAATVVVMIATGSMVPAQRVFTPAEGADPLHAALDQILDVNVRDGLVYYRALRSDRSRLDRYVTSLNVPAPTYAGWSPNQKIAFWLNAYDAFVLETVIDNYPIRSRSAAAPASSIRQIPGAFDQTKHRAAGRSVTLDEIEKNILPEFKDARLYLALGRGAMGSGRLRSEAYTAQRLERQLASVQSEFVGEEQMIQIDRLANQVTVTPIMSWREAEFVAGYDPGAAGPFAQRSPIERALIAFVLPHVLRLEKEMLQKNEFKVAFRQFDWRLNDLTGRSE
jgi:Protein of unknown function, DUF547